MGAHDVLKIFSEFINVINNVLRISIDDASHGNDLTTKCLTNVAT